jgi:hypothetical protein
MTLKRGKRERKIVKFIKRLLLYLDEGVKEEEGGKLGRKKF